ncbi:MAG TPA: trypsin-like peptidase domain-containing protein [Streptosporangiaceae bacterium]|nr:trypsin-like peptidase domain-containing protein [Streptosporangiaceae bacterium]
MRRSWRWNWALLAVASVGTAVIVFAFISSPASRPITRPAANQASAPPPTRPASAGPLSRHSSLRQVVPRGADPVGALFSRDGNRLGAHFCTASVVNSRSGDLLITAAHCVRGISLAHAGRLLFAPGYVGGKFPRGLWVVTRRFTDSRWAAHQDPNDDVAFLTVRPVAKADGLSVPVPLLAPGATVRGVAGADRLRFGAPLPVPIRAIGYPDGTGQRVSCSTRAVEFHPGSLRQVMFVCPGFADGTSGGPMISAFNPAKRTGAVIGVIGGYQQGGDSPSISYSSAFAGQIRALYQRAAKAR